MNKTDYLTSYIISFHSPSFFFSFDLTILFYLNLVGIVISVFEFIEKIVHEYIIYHSS